MYSVEEESESRPPPPQVHGIFLSPVASATLNALLADSDPVMDKLEETARNLQRRLAILKRKHSSQAVVNNTTNNSNNNVRNNPVMVVQGFPIRRFIATVIWLLLLLCVRGWLTWPWM